MKFQIDITDFWLDEEENLIPALQDYITNHVVDKINNQIEKKVDGVITKQVKAQIEKQLLAKTNKLIDEFIEKGEISTNGPNNKVSVEDYIKMKFNNRNGWGSPKEQIDKLAEIFGSELKNRYDLLFATQIVKSLDKEGLLRENVAKLILKDNQKKQRKSVS